jgi:hypothetical protein
LHTNLEKLTALVTVVFTGILAFSTALQVWAFVKSERAFVYIDQISVEAQRISSAHPLLLLFQIKNSGRAAGFVVDSSTDLHLGTDPLPRIPPYTHSGDTIKGPVVPSGTMYATSHPRLDGREFTIPQDWVDAINGGTMRLFVFGYLTYRDEFSFLLGQTVIGYCYVLDPTRDPNVNLFNSCDRDEYIYTKSG